MWSNWMKSYFGSKDYSSIEEYQDCDCDVKNWQKLQKRIVKLDTTELYEVLDRLAIKK